MFFIRSAVTLIEFEDPELFLILKWVSPGSVTTFLLRPLIGGV